MYQKKAAKFVLKNGELFFKKMNKGKESEIRYVVNTEEQRILHECHNDPTAGHMGVKRTLKRINERFRWPGMVKDVTNMVARCDICQRANRKLVHTAPELRPVPVKSPWHHIGIDFVGPILESKSGNLYILTIFMRMSLPKVITTDNGTEFKNDLKKHLMELLGIEQRFTTAYIILRCDGSKIDDGSTGEEGDDGCLEGHGCEGDDGSKGDDGFQSDDGSREDGSKGDGCKEDEGSNLKEILVL
ncbi:hypothetical protein EMCRGX_G008302 [Ephydatia muelleri]